MADLATLVGGTAIGRIPHERLRTAQFLLLQDLFLRLLDSEQPDLAVFFTNHVAAAMHRYWYAMYPNDFDEAHYDERWVARNRGEIAAALVTLDRYLRRLHRWCERHDRTLIVLSSMGQGPSRSLQAAVRREVVIVEPRRFLDTVGIDPTVEVRGSMVPQLTLECRTPQMASEVAAILADVEAGEVFWDVDGADTVVTLTYHLDPVSSTSVRLAGARYPADEIGVAVYEVDDHSSGRHIPEGILGIANSPSFKPADDNVLDALNVAPAILTHLGVTPPDHLQEPVFSV
ncbi:MAG: hypothetical protein AAF531_09895 [Actinomycetota bacterium]